MGREHFLILGQVARTHGLQGEVKVACFADSWEPFGSLDRVWVGPTGGPYRCLDLESAKGQGRVIIVRFVGVANHESAAGLVGCEVAIPRAEAPQPPDGVFYHYDILGLEVEEGGRSLGTVQEILETPAHDVYVIQGPLGEWMLPATRSHIRRIDLAAGRIEIEPGMHLETATSGGEERAEEV